MSALGILSLRLKNFRRYTDESFDFRAGLNFIEGENNAGKTSVLYAIEYALFGRVGNLGPAALIRPKARGVGVELRFVGRDGRIYRLQRAHIKPKGARTKVYGHFTLKVQESEEEAERYLLASDFEDLESHLATAIQQALGLSKRAWDLAVHVQQGRITEILDGTPQLDIVLGVTSAVFVEEELRAMALEREKSASALPALEAALDQLKLERDRHLERQARLETQRSEAETAFEALGSGEEALAAARAELAPLRQAVSALEQALAASTRAEEEVQRARRGCEEQGDPEQIEASLQLAEASGSQARGLLAKTEAGIETLQEQRSEAQGQRGDVAGRLARLQGLEAVCDHCGQEVDPDHLAEQLPARQAELEALEARLKALDAQLERANQDRRAQQQAIERAQAELHQARGQQQALERAQLQLEAAAEGAEASQARLEQARSEAGTHASELDTRQGLLPALRTHLAQRHDALTGRAARMQAEREHAQTTLRSLDRELRELRSALADAERQLARTQAEAEALRRFATQARRLRALSKAFKSVKQELREGATAEMATRALEIHRHLSGDDRELKKLSIDPKRYTVQVTPRDVGTSVPAALYQGGGHRLLLGLAVKLALAERIGPCPFVLLDEPTYGLDVTRKRALLERIAELKVSEQILLITHADLGDAEGHRLRVVRDGSSSRLEVSA